MKILVVHNKEINYYPPVKSLVDILLDLGHEVIIICYDHYGYAKEKENNLNCKVIGLDELKRNGKFSRLGNIIFMKRKVRKRVSELMNSCNLIWTTTDSTVSLLGKELYKYKNHVMQLMELVDDTPILYYKIFYKLGLHKKIPVHLDRYAKRAKCVVVPEINRGYILKAMWELNKLPHILPNKPYKIKLDNPDSSVLKIVEKLKKCGKKILLYQGVFLKERKLEEFADAARILGNEYVFCIMGRDTEERKQLCVKYPDIIYIPFIAPPYHLLITQISHIGILTYYPTADDLPRKLNVLYCAPNKIYEYAYSGLPMVGNNIPGLSQIFDKYSIGKCFNELNAESIVKAVCAIEQNYNAMQGNCRNFYDDTDMKQIVSDILSV